MTTSTYKTQLESKTKLLKQLLDPFFSGNIQVYDSPPANYRMRAEFRIWHEGDDSFHIMFNPETKQKYRVDEFLAGSKLINVAMREVMKLVRSDPVLREKLYQVDYLTTLSNQLLVTMIYRKPIEDRWLDSANKLKQHLNQFAQTNVIGRARKQKILFM